MSNWEDEFSYCDHDGAELEIILCANERIAISVAAGHQCAWVGFSRDDALVLAQNILEAVAKNSD